MPAIPVTCTRWARRSSVEAWKTSFTRRSSRSRPTKGASRRSDLSRPPTPATTRSAWKRGTGSALPFNSWVPASWYATAASVARLVASPTSTVPGWLWAWMREAVLTRSPATMPWPFAPRFTAAVPVNTPARAASSGARTSAPNSATASTRSRAARTARSASSSWAKGAPHTAITASPMNFSTVPP